jgi:hypothetical protein
MEAIEKEIIRRFPPKTKFISLFGAKDEVSEKDKYYIKDGCGFVLGKNEFRMIYDGSWANVLQLVAKYHCEIFPNKISSSQFANCEF